MTTPNPFTTAPAPADPSQLFGGLGAAPAQTPAHHFPLPPEVRQYRPTYVRGAYALPPLPGTTEPLKAPRVTSKVKALDDMTGLMKWKTREVVKGVAAKPSIVNGIDLLAERRDLNNDLDRAIDEAEVEAGSKRSAELGTAIHGWIEGVERGELSRDEVPRQFMPYVNAYFDRLAEHGVRPIPELVERIVYNSSTGWAGTFDNIYELATGERVIGDKKTSKTTSFRLSALSFAQQLATYAGADYMLAADGESWKPMPPVSDAFAVIAHVPSDEPGQCTLETIDLDYGRRAIELAKAVADCRQQAPAGVLRRWELPDLGDAVDMCTSPAELAELWENNAGVWTDELTARGQKRLADLAR